MGERTEDGLCQTLHLTSGSSSRRTRIESDTVNQSEPSLVAYNFGPASACGGAQMADKVAMPMEEEKQVFRRSILIISTDEDEFQR